MNSGVLERLLDDLALRIDPFAVCEVSRGWRLRLERLSWVTLHFVLEGVGVLQSERSPTQKLSPYSLVVVPPCVRHSIAVGRRASHEVLAGQSAQCAAGPRLFAAGPAAERELRIACGRVEATYGGGPGLFDLLPAAIVLDFTGSERMRTIFEHLLDEERNPSPGGRAMTAALMNECLVLLFRRLIADAGDQLPWLAALEDPRLAPVLAAVLENPEQQHSLESLSASALMSRSAFAREFTERFGNTPMRFVRDIRLRRGAELLRSTRVPVDAVARQVGYSSRSQFSKSFKERYGQSPAQFRGSPSGSRAEPAGSL